MDVDILIHACKDAHQRKFIIELVIKEKREKETPWWYQNIQKQGVEGYSSFIQPDPVHKHF